VEGLDWKQIRSEAGTILSVVAGVASILALALVGRWPGAVCIAVFVATIVFVSRDLLSVKWSPLVLSTVAGAVVLVIFYLVYSKSDALRKLHVVETQVASIRPTRMSPMVSEFVVYGTEVSPAPGSFDSNFAYEFVEPDSSSTSPSAGQHERGDHVKVECRVNGGNWYRLTDHNFMQSSAIRLVPASGQPQPPRCKETVETEPETNGPFG
jgi:hypothetical protein